MSGMRMRRLLGVRMVERVGGDDVMSIWKHSYGVATR